MSKKPDTAAPLSVAPPVDVSAFLAEHGAPYDAEADTYQRDPLVSHGRHGKATAIYNAHSYHTKVPPEAIVPYLEHYTQPGDVVLDPFCGSGMTGVAALLTGRNAILSDLSPAAVHIAYNYCTPVDVDALKKAWSEIKAEVAEEFRWLYGTTCDKCQGPGTIQYTVWSDVVSCHHCHEEIVLWDSAVVRSQTQHGYDPPLSSFAADGWIPPTVKTAPAKRTRGGDTGPRSSGDVLEEFACPSCSQATKKADSPYQRIVPVMTVLECDGWCKPKRMERATTDGERERLDQIARSELPYWIPDTPFEETREMWRGVHRDQGITRVRDFWTPRNLWALASLWSRATQVQDERIGRGLRFSLTPALWLGSRLYRYRKGGGGGEQGKLAVSSLTRENNVIGLIDSKLSDIIDGKMSTRYGANVLIRQASATQLTGVFDSSIDYIFTDPPFGSNLFYSDLSLLWEAWLEDLTPEGEEAVWNKSRRPDEGGKTLEQYGDLMARSFAEMYRVLKPGRWATIVFSNSDDRVWHAIQTGAQHAGFAAAGAGTLDKKQRSFKGVRGDKGDEKVVTKDVVMNLLKPVEGADVHVPEDIGDPEEYVREHLHGYLGDLASRDGAAAHQRTTQALYDHIMTAILRQRVPMSGFSLAFIQSVAQESFKQVDGLWYRRGDRVQSDNPRLTMDVVDESSAVAWLDHRLSAQQMTEAQIIPEFNQASAGARISGGLTRLLRENFVQDPRTNRWRVPTVLERDALNDAGKGQRRRVITRAAQGESTDATAAELLEMVEEAVRLEMYSDAELLLGRMHAPDLSKDDRERVALLRSVIDAHREEG